MDIARLRILEWLLFGGEIKASKYDTLHPELRFRRVTHSVRRIAAADRSAGRDAAEPWIERASAGSWILPGASGGDLLYLPGGCSGTCIVSYPAGEVVGSAGPGTYGACGDGKGNVFIANNDALDEYSHGATIPINSFNLPGTVRSCGVDPQTGNVAVAFYTS